MPTTPDRPDGTPAGPLASANDAADAEAVALVARETVPVDRNHPTVSVRPADGGRPTELIDDTALGRRETVRVPGPRRPQPGEYHARRAPMLVAAGFATAWAGLLSYLPVAAVVGLARTLEGQGGLGGAAHAGLAGWLLGHGVPIGTSLGPLGLAPLLLTVLAVWRLNRAGVHVTRAMGARRSGSVRAALLVTASIAGWHAVLGALAAVVVDAHGMRVSAAHAAVNFLVLGAFGAALGAVHSTAAHGVLARRLPRPLRHGLRTGVVAALLVLAAGAVATGLSVAVGGRRAADLIAAYHTGVGGQAGITLLSLAYGANAAVWAAAFLLGPGFTLGVGSAVRLTEVTVGPLPSLPLLAGLPEGPFGSAGATLLAVPVLAGMAAGWLMTRRMRRPRPARPGESVAAPRTPSWPRVLISAGLAGPTAGLVLGALAAASGGPLGSGRLAEIGPDPGTVALVATAVIAVSATAGAAAGRAFRAPTR